jgi:lipoate-protein ligase A
MNILGEIKRIDRKKKLKSLDFFRDDDWDEFARTIDEELEAEVKKINSIVESNLDKMEDFDSTQNISGQQHYNLLTEGLSGGQKELFAEMLSNSIKAGDFDVPTEKLNNQD